MKKICIVTASRSEYGLLKWIIDTINNDHTLELQLVVTGGHLSAEQGLTYRLIEEDGYSINAKINMNTPANSSADIVKSMGTCSIGCAEVFKKLNPDILIILGDRYELLPICSAALIMNIPIAHISGGDITVGAIDNEIRNAVTMLSSLHFPGVEDSADNIIRMRKSPENIFTVGEPGLESFTKQELWSREKLSRSLNLDVDKKWILLTQHPETKISIENNILFAKNIIQSLLDQDNLEIVITKSNLDFGGTQLNEYWKVVAEQHSNIHLFDSLGQIRYLSFMNEVCFVIGNSSSGIVEAPMLATPVVNIGDRQTGRYQCENIINSEGSLNSLNEAITLALTEEFNTKLRPNNYYGDGNTSAKILVHIKEFLRCE